MGGNRPAVVGVEEFAGLVEEGGVGVGAVLAEPAAVPEDVVDVAVLGEERFDVDVVFFFHESCVFGVGGVGGVAEVVGEAVGAGDVVVAGVAPGERGVVEADFEVGVAAGGDVFGEEVAVEGLHGGEGVGVRGVEEAEAFVVAGGEAHPFHAGVVGELCPLVGMVVVGVEVLRGGGVGELAVFFGRDGFVVLDPFAAGGDGVKAPVDEHAELGVEEPGEFLVGELDDVVLGLGDAWCGWRRGGGEGLGMSACGEEEDDGMTNDK